MNDKAPRAKEVIRESLQEADGFTDDPRRGGPPGRPGGPRPGGPREPQGRFSPRERNALKDILLAELAHRLGDGYYQELADVIINNRDPDEGQIKHFLDEAPAFYEKLGPDAKALLDKLVH